MKPIDRLSDDEFAHLVQHAIALPEASPALARAAIGLWPATQAVALKGVAKAALQFVSAALSFDSWTCSPVALGLRAVMSDTRHLLFSAADRDIDLRISPVADRFALTGQVLGPDESGLVELMRQSGDEFEACDSRVASLDELGGFRLDNVRRGTYHLSLRIGCEVVMLPPIVVGARTG